MSVMQFEKITMPDGYAAAARWWRPTAPRGAVLYFHGIQSHGGWFEASGQALADAGFIVLMPDRRGCGLNPPPRGHYATVEQCEQDTNCCLDALLRGSGFPFAHLVGVSWGGKQVLLLGAKHPEKVRTMSLVAPGLFPKIHFSRAERFRIGMSLANNPTGYFDIPLNDASYLTANPVRLAFIENDPLKLSQVSVSFLRVARRLDRLASKIAEGAYAGPIHLMLAGGDRIIDNEKTREWLRGTTSKDIQITEFPNAHHTLEFEPDADTFLQGLTDWIVARCGPTLPIAATSP